MCVCKGCGRAIASEFYYCPWCGESKIKVSSEESSDLLCEKYKRIRTELRLKHIKEMSDRLDSLEQELSMLVLSAEMHK